MIKFVLIFFFSISSAHCAEKLGTIVDLLDKRCQRIDLERSAVIRLVRKVYLTCEPGSFVSVTKACELPCLRENLGNVVGNTQFDWD